MKNCPYCRENALRETGNKWSPYKCENCKNLTANPTVTQ